MHRGLYHTVARQKGDFVIKSSIYLTAMTATPGWRAPTTFRRWPFFDSSTIPLATVECRSLSRPTSSYTSHSAGDYYIASLCKACDNGLLCPRPIGHYGIARSVILSVLWHSCRCHRHAGCLQLSHCRAPEMCGPIRQR